MTINLKKLQVFVAVVIALLAGLVAMKTLNEGRAFRQLPMVSEPWPGDISYYDDTSYNNTLDLAIKRWHDTGLPIRFIGVSDKDQADVVIKDDKNLLEKNCNSADCKGNAQIGYSPISFEKNVIYLHPLLEADNNIIDTKMLAVTTHELGHVLGLEHSSNSCSIMNKESDCQDRQLELDISEKGSAFSCGPFPSDLTELSSLYNFTPKSDFSSTCLDPVANSNYYQEIQARLTSQEAGRDNYLKNFSSE